MPEVKQIISNHNKTILIKESNTESTTNNCSCRVKETCPVDKKCQTSSLIYQATVIHDSNKGETYVGLTDNTFKSQYHGHTNSFRNKKYRNATALSNHIWMLKDQTITHSLKSKIRGQRKSLQTFRKKNCSLCDLEKIYIIFKPDLASVNHRNELATDCRHSRKYLLSNN